MIDNIIKWFWRHQIESLADFVVVGLIWTCLSVMSGCLVYLLAQLAGYVVGCL